MFKNSCGKVFILTSILRRSIKSKAYKAKKYNKTKSLLVVMSDEKTSSVSSEPQSDVQQASSDGISLFTLKRPKVYPFISFIVH